MMTADLSYGAASCTIMASCDSPLSERIPHFLFYLLNSVHKLLQTIELSFTPFPPNITWCLMYFLFGSEFCALFCCKGNKLYGCTTCAQKVTQLHKYKSRLWNNLPMLISCCNTINNADSTCMEHLFSKFNDLSNQIINFDCWLNIFQIYLLIVVTSIYPFIQLKREGPVPGFKLSFKVQRWLEEKNWQNIF